MTSPRVFTSAPLPFQGQKRNWTKDVRALLVKNLGDGTGWTIVDVFGGSGLLAHTAKRTCPKARVIYNDYDNFCARLSKVDETNRILAGVHEVILRHSEGMPPPTRAKVVRLSDKAREAVLEYLGEFPGADFSTIGRPLTHSARFPNTLDDLRATKQFYYPFRLRQYNPAGYLDGLEVVREDYRALIGRVSPADDSGDRVLLLLDPPYTHTSAEGYDGSFTIADYMRLLCVRNVYFALFGSSKSQTLAVVDCLKEKAAESFPALARARHIKKNATLAASIGYVESLTTNLD